MNIYNTLVTSAATWPDRVAIVDAYGEFTFAALLLETEKLKDNLLHAGLKKDNAIGILTGNNRYFLTALYATLACDAIAMPIGYQQTDDEIEKAIDEANLHFILLERSESVRESRGLSISMQYDSLLLYQTERSTHHPTVDFIPNAAIMRFTSGTTGTAKCVVLSHQSVWDRIQAANQGLHLSDADRVLWVLPMAYHFIVSIMLYIQYGVGIIVCDDFLADTLVEKANEYNATVLYCAPLHIRLLAMNKNTTVFSSMKKVISTTTGISRSICEMFHKRYHIPVIQAFGIIEVGLPIINSQESIDNPEAAGHPLPAFKVSFLDENFNPLPAGKTGLLAIQGPGMFDGYLKPRVRATDIFRGGMFITGDYAEQNADGLILIRGRANSMIHVLGNKVFPDEVEDILLQYPGVLQARVFGQLHPFLGEIVVSELVLQDQQPFDAEDIINHCRKYLSSFKVPQRVILVQHINMTGSGKIKRA